MHRRINTWQVWAAVAGLLVVGNFGGASAARAAGPDIVIVAHASAGITNLSRSEAKRYLTGRATQWANGSPVAIVLPPSGSASMTWLSRDVLRLSESAYREFLLRQTLSGTIPRPIEVGSEAAIAKTVAAHAGAISASPRTGEGVVIVELK